MFRNGLSFLPLDGNLSRIFLRMNCVSFDTIGTAGFGHEFGSLEGRQSDVKDVFESFGFSPPQGLSLILPLLAPVLPFAPNDSKLEEAAQQSPEQGYGCYFCRAIAKEPKRKGDGGERHGTHDHGHTW